MLSGFQEYFSYCCLNSKFSLPISTSYLSPGSPWAHADRHTPKRKQAVKFNNKGDTGLEDT